MAAGLEVAHRAGALLGEGPTWDGESGRLLWVDILASEVHSFDPASRQDSVFRTQQHVGAAKPRAGGGLVVNLRDGVGLYDRDGSFRWLADLAVEGCRGNDAAVDAAGHLWAGTMRYDEAPGGGRLYRVAPGGEVVTVLDGVAVSNGIGWSPDGRRMYYADSPTRRVDVFDVDPGTGLVPGGRGFLDLEGVPGFPDGLAVDAEGRLLGRRRGAALDARWRAGRHGRGPRRPHDCLRLRWPRPGGPLHHHGNRRPGRRPARYPAAGGLGLRAPGRRHRPARPRLRRLIIPERV